jgi:DNA polymerase-3 subunit alpha
MSDYDMNKRMVESLIKSGAMDRLGKRRSQIMASYETIIDGATSKKGNNIAGQLDFFSMAQGLDTGLDFEYPDIPEIPISIRLAQEKEATGLYFSGHPLDSYRDNADDIEHVEIVSVTPEMAEGERRLVNIVGIVSSVTVKTTRNGDKMAFFTLSDRYGEIECIVFARTYSQISYLIREDAALCVSGSVQAREDEDVKFIVSSVKELKKNGEYRPEDKKHNAKEISQDSTPKQSFGNVSKAPSKLYLRVKSLDTDEFLKAKNLVEIFEGTIPVIFYNSSAKEYCPSGLAFDATDYTINQLKSLLGDENVVLK